MQQNDYQIRKSFYNLVELSLLAKMYIQHCLPLQNPQSADASTVPQTLLMMKATEQKGHLEVAIYGENPVGFLWQYEGRLITLYVNPEHRGKGVEEKLRSAITH